MRKATTLQLSALALAAALSGSAVPTLSEEDKSTAAVLDHHVRAFATGDIEAMLADYMEDSVFITPKGVLQGPADIRPLFAAMIEEFSSPAARWTIHTRHAAGPVGYMTWSAETPKNRYRFATDTIYVVDGRIRYQTFAADVVPK